VEPRKDPVVPLTLRIGTGPLGSDRRKALRALDTGRVVVLVGVPRAVHRLAAQIIERMPDVRSTSERPEVETAPGSDERVRSDVERLRLFRELREPTVIDIYWPRGPTGRGHSR
jgi:hypothetical protein